MSEGDAESEQPESTAELFSALKPHCAKVLDLLRTPSKTAASLPAMARLLRRAPPRLLQPLLDYTLIPLLLLVDAAVECRSGKERLADSLVSDLRVSDAVAEGVVACLEVLLSKCRLGSVDQMVTILKKLTKGAMLLPSEASEEFHEGIILCLRALLLKLGPCAIECCMCKNVSFSQLLTDSDWLTERPQDNREHHIDSDVCLLSFLRSQDASAAVGHLLSLLFQIAENEVARGLRGSSKLRKEALLTLRVLIATVGSSDALAFFLPGVVSRFSKALNDSKNAPSGAAGNSEGIDHAVRGLAEFLSIVLKDEANQNVLSMYAPSSDCFDGHKSQSSRTVLEALRDLSSFPQERRERSTEIITSTPSLDISNQVHERDINNQKNVKIMFASRTENWLMETATHVKTFLSATFPHLCIHPSERVRKGLQDAIRSLFTNCCVTLKDSKVMLLECICILVCDDSEMVSAAAQDSLASLLSSGNFLTQNEIIDILDRLIEHLPKVILGNEEIVAISHAQKLFAFMYYVGPEKLLSILSSPVKVVHFLKVLVSCMGPSSQFTGAARRTLSSRSLKVGLLHSMRDLQVDTFHTSANLDLTSRTIWNPRVSIVSDRDLQDVSEIGDHKIPRAPPWCTHPGSRKLHASLAGIVRLVGLSVLSGDNSLLPFSIIVDFLLESVRKLVSDIRMKEYNNESWKSWYDSSSSGQLLRNASTSACILNEIMYGISDESVCLLNKLFQKSCSNVYVHESSNDYDIRSSSSKSERTWWNIRGDDIMDNLISCVGDVLHEYMADEIWDLPIDYNSFLLLQCIEEDPSLYLFHDATVLKQIIIDGIGIFNLSLGISFRTSGFMHNALFLLLRNLICSNNLVKTSCETVLRVISTVTGYPTVGHLVVANADYIIDCLCRNLRHLDVDPQIPNILSAMLSFIGVAEEILPLLEEPMRIVSLELEVLGRHQHPKLTDPFLKALREITKASRLEASHFPSKYESFCMDLKSKVLHMKQKYSTDCATSGDFDLEHWEDVLTKLNEKRRYRRIVGSVAESCLKAAIPLMASKMESICLMALDIIECGSIALAYIEKAYKLEKESKEAIDSAVKFCSFQQSGWFDDLPDESDENRVLPTMNKIWPYLIICLKNKSSVAVIQQSMYVLGNIIQIAGGDFFVRRLRNDGNAIWQLLSCSPFQRKSLSQKKGGWILLPFRGVPDPLESSMSEVSSLKVQEAALNMIGNIASNKNSATAMEAVFKKVSGLVVGIACSTVDPLRDASIRALSGLACMDSDLVWLLVADIYYSLKKADVPQPPMHDLPGIHELLPDPPSTKDYLFLQFGAEGFGFNIDPIAVETIFHKMQSGDFGKAVER